MGLDSEFLIVRNQILALKPAPSLGIAYHLVAEDEQQRSITSTRRPTTEAAAFQDYVKTNANQQGNKAMKKTAKKWWPGKNKQEKGRRKAAYVEVESSPIEGMTKDQYEQFLKHFAYEETNTKSGAPQTTNMAEPVTIPNGEVVPVEGRGNHTLSNETKVKGILHIPNFNCNLLSVSKLSSDLRCVVSFFLEFFVMQDLASRNLIGAGRCKNGLYRKECLE
ncbi:hypothetical protein Tco_1391087 [Tanacetum coccineum]